MNQRKFLKGLASEVTPVKPFAGEFVRRSGLGSPSNAQRAVDALLDCDVIDRENGSFLIDRSVLPALGAKSAAIVRPGLLGES